MFFVLLLAACSLPTPLGSLTATGAPPPRCSRDDLRGCEHWSDLLRRSGEVVAQEQLAQWLCDAGEATQCGVVAELGAVIRRPNALDLARSSCTSGVASGCYAVGVLSGEIEEKREAIERACRLGHGKACEARQLFEPDGRGALASRRQRASK